jgi:GTP cyclohydrolase-4
MVLLPDVQALRANHELKLTRVGVTGVKKLVRVLRPGKRDYTVFTPTIDAFVDLPGTQRGIHMSRNLEAVNETLEKLVRDPSQSLEGLAGAIAEELLQKHGYATVAEVRMLTDYFMKRRNPSGLSLYEPYALGARAVAIRGKKTWRTIGVEVVGMNACPCAMETVRELMGEAWPKTREMPKEAPGPTHNQRNRTTLEVETHQLDAIDADELIELVERCQSAPTFEVLKRGDEAKLVLQAHGRPLFVEDIVREVLTAFAKKHGRLPDDTILVARCESEESIHKHNAFAERSVTLGDLKNGAA